MRVVANEKADAVEATAIHPKPKVRAAAQSWGLNVMLVDDDAADASLIIGLLQRHPSVGAANVYHEPDRALADIAAGWRQPDLILLDINMPKTNGFAFIAALAKMEHARTIPVVFLTTSNFARDVEQARLAQACGYIVKPESFDDLRRRLDAAVKQTINGKWS